MNLITDIIYPSIRIDWKGYSILPLCRENVRAFGTCSAVVKWTRTNREEDIREWVALYLPWTWLRYRMIFIEICRKLFLKNFITEYASFQNWKYRDSMKKIDISEQFRNSYVALSKHGQNAPFVACKCLRLGKITF